MFKKTIYILFILFLSFSFGENILEAGVKYDEISAKVEAFKGVQRKIDKIYFKDYLKDLNYKENIEFIKNKTFEIENKRYLCPFYLKNTLGAYAVMYFDNEENVYYYNILGNLVKFDIITTNSYPKKVYSYSRYGNLISVAFEISEKEQYVYTDKGKLVAHWVDNDVETKSKLLKSLNIKRME